MAALRSLCPQRRWRQWAAAGGGTGNQFHRQRPAGVPRAAATTGSEEDFPATVGVTEMLRAALLKVLEARPEEPIAFLAHYFENMGLRSPANGGAGEPPGRLLLQQQRLGRAPLWHLRLTHHSQRCGAGPGLDWVGAAAALPAPSGLRAAPHPRRRCTSAGRTGKCRRLGLAPRRGADRAGFKGPGPRAGFRGPGEATQLSAGMVLLVDSIDDTSADAEFPRAPHPTFEIMEPTQDLVPRSCRVPGLENPAHSIRK